MTHLALGTSAAIVGCGRNAQERAPAHGCEPEGEGISAGEDLMREHGVLERVLVVWGEVEGPLRRGDAFDVAAVGDSVGLVQRFVEQYHERLEEELVFPRLESVGREVALVRTLRDQHRIGRGITAEVAGLLRGDLELAARARIADRMSAYSRMVLAHVAREDTIVFPTLREILGASGVAELGEELEEREHRIVGEGGFENAVAEAGRIEVALGMEHLASFSPARSPA